MTYNITEAADVCNEALEYFSLVTGDVSTLDARIFKYDYEPYAYWKDMLVNSTQVAALYESLHVTKFNAHSDTIEKMFKPDIMVDYTKYYDYLIFNRFPTILNGAEYDNRDGAK
jgi:hypothetical protein